MTFAQFVFNFFKIHYHFGVFEKKIVLQVIGPLF